MARLPQWLARAHAFHESLDNWLAKGLVACHLEKQFGGAAESKEYLAGYINLRERELAFRRQWIEAQG